MPDKRYVAASLVAKAEGDAPSDVFTFRATSEAVDRQGEVVTADGWEMKNFLANPVILDSHQYSGIENIVGRAVRLERVGDAWEADIKFNASPRGQLAKTLVESGDLSAVSVGFKPIKIEQGKAAGDPPRHTQKELLEISVVPVPANADAVRLRSVESTELRALFEDFAEEYLARRAAPAPETPAPEPEPEIDLARFDALTKFAQKETTT